MADLRNPVVRRGIHRRYAALVIQGKVPELRAFVRRNPEGGWTVYIGRRFHPQSNLRYSFERDQVGLAHDFARITVARIMVRRINGMLP